jgi:hypothetical protein
MREKKKSLERLYAANARLHQLEEARLAEIEKQMFEALEDRRAMFGFLENVERKDPLLLRLACRRVVEADRGAAALDAQAARQRQTLARRGAQNRGVEKMLKEAAAAMEREEQKRALLDIVERLGGRAPTSLP